MTLEMLKSLLGVLGLALLFIEVTGAVSRSQKSADARQEREGPLDLTISWIIQLSFYGVILLACFALVVMAIGVFLPDAMSAFQRGISPIADKLTPYVDGLAQTYSRMPYLFFAWPLGLYLVAIPVSLFRNYPKFLVGFIGGTTTILSYFLDFILPDLLASQFI